MKTPPPNSPQTGPRIVVALVVLLIAVLWFKRTPAPLTVSSAPPEATTSEAPVALPVPAPTPAPPETPALGNANSPAAINPTDTPVDFVAEFQRCFPDYPGIASPQDFVGGILNSADLQSREVIFENLQINDGSAEQRLSVTGQGHMAEVRTFAISPEGQATGKGPAEILTKESAEAVKQDFLRRGRTTYQQRKEAVVLGDGLQGEIEWQDDKVRNVLFFRADRSFFCRDSQCQCRLQNNQ